MIESLTGIKFEKLLEQVPALAEGNDADTSLISKKGRNYDRVQLSEGFLACSFCWLSALIGLAGFAFWLWMLIHAITNKGLGDGEKIVWVLVIIFLPFWVRSFTFLIGRPKAELSGTGVGHYAVSELWANVFSKR